MRSFHDRIGGEAQCLQTWRGAVGRLGVLLFDGEEKSGDFKPPKMYKTLVNNGINYNYLSLNWCRISSMNSILIIIISTNDDNHDNSNIQ